MDIRRTALAFVFFSSLTATAPNPGRATPSPAPRALAPPASLGAPSDLFSRRAVRRAATLLRLRWYELRMARLERVRKAIKREISIDALLEEAAAPPKR